MRELKWNLLSENPPPMDGTEILLCEAKDADGEILTRDSFGIFIQVAAWWGEKHDGEWTVYCSQVLEPRLHFTPTHWLPLDEFYNSLVASLLEGNDEH